MRVSIDFGDAVVWARRHFGDVRLGDVRRTRRVCQLAAGWARQPGASIPRLSGGQAYPSKAAYQLLGQARTTPQALQAPHRHQVQHLVHQPGTYLLVEDTTELRWCTGEQQRPGLGPVGMGKSAGQGVLLHSLVAAAWPAFDPTPAARRPPVPLLGLVDQQFHVRQLIPAAEQAHPHGGSRLRQGRVRESVLWTRSLAQVDSPPPGVRWVVVADRGADIYEHLQQCQAQGLGFVVRAAQDRAVLEPLSGQPAGRLFAMARAQPSLGTFPLTLHARGGQPARQVQIHVSCTTVALRAPQRPGRATGRGAPVACGVVRAWEETPAPHAPGLEWVLLCDQPVTSFAQAHERARQYASRWLIEDFHKALKTGLGAERLQLQTAPRLFAAVALLSVVALALVDLREQARYQPDGPAEAAGLPAPYLLVLRQRHHRSIRTSRDVYDAVAALGGHLGRAGDGPPGWQTLWHGLATLRLLVEGMQLAALLTAEEPTKKLRSDNRSFP